MTIIHDYLTLTKKFEMKNFLKDHRIFFLCCITALTLDMSEAGAATFNSSVTVGANLDVSSGTIKLDGDYPTGSNNVALGDTALDSVTSGGQNTAIGSIALTALTTASFNTAIGYKALEDNISGTKNTAIGSNAASNTTGANNVAIGVRTLFFNTIEDISISII